MEEWHPIVGWEGLYEVSSLGRIRGLCSNVIRSCPVNNSGYPCIILSQRKNGVRRTQTKTVHHHVAAAFLGPRPPKHDIDHVDGDKTNNRADNLEYVSRGENHRRAYALGLRVPAKRNVAHGERHHWTRLTEAQVREIRGTPFFHGINEHFAAKFGTTFSNVSAIRLRKSWKRI